MGGVQGWLGWNLPGALSKIADKRKRAEVLDQLDGFVIGRHSLLPGVVD